MADLPIHRFLERSEPAGTDISHDYGSISGMKRSASTQSRCTSLPELVISVMAAMRGQSELAFGNVVGSNIYNILGILGVTAIVKPISIPPAIAQIDIWVLVATTIILLVVATTHKKISRLEGGLMILAYGAYVVSLILRTVS